MNLDDKLRKYFQELRATDAQRAPAFNRVTRTPVPPVTLPWWQLSLGAAVLVAVMLTWMTHRRQPVADTQQWAALSNWHATTDELLSVSSTPWGSTISTPTDSWIENSSSTNQKKNL